MFGWYEKNKPTTKKKNLIGLRSSFSAFDLDQMEQMEDISKPNRQ